VPTPHADLRELVHLIGTWRGAGEGHYPTIEPFTYEEEVEFRHSGKPLLAYAQMTRRADGTPLHSERGYWRTAGGSGVELVLAHSFGAVEVAGGTAAGRTIETRSSTIHGTPSAKRIDEVRRRLTWNGDALVYDLWMDAVGAGLHHHLHARLERVD